MKISHSDISQERSGNHDQKYRSSPGQTQPKRPLNITEAYVKIAGVVTEDWPFLYWRTHYPSRRTWANIRCSSGYASLV